MRHVLSYFTLLACLSSNALAQATANSFVDLRIFEAKDGSGTAQTYDVHATVTNVDIGDTKNVSSQTLVICPRGKPVDDLTCNATYKRSSVASEMGGVLIQAEPGNTLDMNLINEIAAGTVPTHCMDKHAWNATGWKAESGLVNLHTHGLLVKPDPRRTDGTYGDYVYDCTQQGAAAAPVFPNMHYKIDIPGGAESQPKGMNWFHPHVHGIAKAQVSSGMAGMIAVGNPEDYLCLKQNSDGTCGDDPAANPFANITTRHMLLRDAQLVQLADAGPWFNNANEDPGFCDPASISAIPGECGMVDGFTIIDTTVQPFAGKWVYTINGVQYPQWQLGAGQTGEIWRLQNASANITYKLSMRLLDVSGNETGKRRSFQVLSMDGAGLPSPNNSTVKPGVISELLLMPGSRADIYIDGGVNVDGVSCADAGVNCPKEVFNFTTGAYQAGFVPGDADTWSEIALGKFILPQRTLALASLALKPQQQLASMRIQNAVASASDQQIMDSIIANCMDVENPNDPALTAAAAATYLENMRKVGDGRAYRRLYFGISTNLAGKEVFLLGDTIVDRSAGNKEFTHSGDEITTLNPVELREVNMHDPKANLCVLFGAGMERWELVNVSKEVHNFHIHQMKFAVDPDPANWRTPSDIDRQTLPDSLIVKAGTEALMHDTIVVPRGDSSCVAAIQNLPTTIAPAVDRFILRPYPNPCNGSGANNGTGQYYDTSGMLPIQMNFNGGHLESKVGTPYKFPFHCHILEHEDAGMMAKIAVVTDLQ